MIKNNIISSIESSNSNKELTRITWTYLHGKLETEIGYDVYYIENCTLTLPLSKGVYELSHNGIKCLLYFWKTSLTDCGLVVYENDIKSNTYAKIKYDENSLFI